MEFEMNLEQTLNEITGKLYGKNIGACTDAQLYTGVLQLTPLLYYQPAVRQINRALL